MKSSLYPKIAKLSVAEILLQVGFENTSEQALNVLGDILLYHVEWMTKRILPFTESEDEIQIKRLLLDLFSNEEYQKDELYQFIEQQNLIRKQLKEKIDGECDQNLLSLLKILPKDVSLETSFKNAKNVALEEVSIHSSVYEEVNVDSFLNAFIENAMKTPVSRTISTNIQPMPSPDVKVNEIQNQLDTINKISQNEDLQETKNCDQLSLLEDFSIREVRKVFKL